MKVYIDFFVIVGTILSVLLSILLYFRGTSVELSLLVGLIGVVVALVLDLFKRIFELSEAINRRFIFLERLTQQPRWLYESIEAVTLSFEVINNEIAKPLFKDAGEEALYIFRDKVEDLGRGVLRVNSNEKQTLLHAVRNAQKEILATSLVHADLASWLTPSGSRYINENALAVERGVRVERVFIYREVTEDLERLCNNLKEKGCIIWMISEEKLPQEKQIDMVLFDRSMIYTASPSHESAVGEYEFSVRPSTIKRGIATFNFILGLSEQR